MFNSHYLRFIAVSTCALAASLSLSQGALAAENAISHDYVFDNVTVIDPESGQVMTHRDVYIRDGQVAEILDGDAPAKDATQMIDGTGRYLVPGLMDMHVHLTIAPVFKSSQALLLANGVTGVRDMAGDCLPGGPKVFLCADALRDAHGRNVAHEGFGPRILQVSSAPVMSEKSPRLPREGQERYMPFTEEQGRAVVDKLAKNDIDLIKIYHPTTLEAAKGVFEQAEANGLQIGGHVPLTMDIVDAAKMGIDSVEHARDLVWDCSRWGNEYRARFIKLTQGDQSVEYPTDQMTLEQSLVTADEALCDTTINAMVDHNVYYVPTHITREFDVRVTEPTYFELDALKYIGEMQWGEWKRDIDNMANEPEDVRKHYPAFFERGLELTKLAHDKGVKIMMGTDANDSMVVPGFSAHHELELLVRAGLSPMEALRAATTVPAQYLDRTDELGGVGVGKLADLVLLDQNPINNISNLQSIAGVMFAGKFYDRPMLDQKLKEIELSFMQ